MQEAQKALLKCLSDALVCASFTSSSNTSTSTTSSNTTPADSMDRDVAAESLAQSVYSLIGTEADAFYIISKNVQISYEQEQLFTVLRGIPYVVLKGLAAAIYYPDPLRRTLGDIDIIVRPEVFSRAYHELVNAGYKTDELPDGDPRHVHFIINGVVIELHRRYAVLNDPGQEELLDSWIYESIDRAVEGRIEDQTFPMLPPLLNGLTLLAHINQHLEDGLGIRHILDWVMYVQKCLPDNKWREFKSYTDQLGLTTLAIVAARIGQMYLHAYPDYKWCAGTRSGLSSGERCVEGSEVDKLAIALLDYCFDCGNFGAKLGQDNTVTMIMSHGKGVDGFFRNLQKRGEGNWKLLSTYPELRPFAWIYQAGRYVKKGLAAGVKMNDVMRNMDESKKRNQLMEQLGVKQQSLRDGNGQKDG
jgi:hypothetical protein